MSTTAPFFLSLSLPMYPSLPRLAAAAMLCLAWAAGLPPARAQSNWQQQQQQQQRQQDQQRQQQQQQQQADRQRQQDQQRQQMQDQQRQQMQDQQRQQMQQQQRQQMQDQQRQQMQQQQQQAQQQQQQQQQQNLQRAQQQARAQGTLLPGSNKPSGVVMSAGTPRMARPLTASEVQRGYTGRHTTDGRALVTYQGQVFAVPATRVGIDASKLAAQRPASRWTPQQQTALKLDVQKLAGLSSGSSGHGGSAAGRRPGAASDTGLSANRVAFAGFYKNAGKRSVDAHRHARGWDFSQPVNKTVLKAGSEVCQWQTPGGERGAYFAACGSSASSLGLADQGTGADGSPEARVERRYQLTQDVEALEGTAARGIDDWSVTGRRVSTVGGGRHYLVDPVALALFADR